MVIESYDNMEDIVVSGAALDEDEVKVTLRGVLDEPGIAARVFSAIAGRNINVDMIVQNVSEEGRTDLSFTIPQSDLDETKAVAETMSDEIGVQGVHYDSNVAKISVVGVGMRSHTGVAERMFNSLAEQDVNIQMISTSEIKISCIIDQGSGTKALQAVHDAFGLGAENSV